MAMAIFHSYVGHYQRVKLKLNTKNDADRSMTSDSNQAYQVAGDDVLPVRYEDSWTRTPWDSVDCNSEETYHPDMVLDWGICPYTIWLFNIAMENPS